MAEHEDTVMLTWRKPLLGEGEDIGEYELVAIGETPDEDAWVSVWLPPTDCMSPTITVRFLDGRVATTDSTREWPIVEEVLPRSRWPREFFAGQRCKVHDADPELRQILDDWYAERAEEDRQYAAWEEEEAAEVDEERE
jgi:hypothetical protein